MAYPKQIFFIKLEKRLKKNAWLLLAEKFKLKPFGV